MAAVGVGGTGGALLAALLLGLRHATDPDHLTAIAALVLDDSSRGVERAGILGLFWGMGHAATLFALGAPVVFIGPYLPEALHRAAEAAIGVLVVGLATRLLVRWRRGAFHAHPHRHGRVWHAHPHAHERAHPLGTAGEADSGKVDGKEPHEHSHADALGRTPFASFGVGLVHGVGGSAAAGILVVAAQTGPRALAGLAVFAAGTALWMAAITAIFGHALARRPVAAHLERLIPAFGLLGVLFGVWYALDALASLPA